MDPHSADVPAEDLFAHLTIEAGWVHTDLSTGLDRRALDEAATFECIDEGGFQRSVNMV